MSDVPDWWRGTRPSPTWTGLTPAVEGAVPSLDLQTVPAGSSGLRPLNFFCAEADGVDLALTELHLTAWWSAFDGCTFRQRVRPVLNEHGIAAQGSLGGRPSIYRSCVFERIRFKTAGGFSLGEARFEDCTFLNCRWEGSFAHSADFIGCRFIGKMNGCVWFGEDRRSPEGFLRRNDIVGNDFTETVFTDNVGWRYNYPVDDQLFPDGYMPRSRF